MVLACYLPPGYPKKRGEDALEYINDTIVHVKRRFKDPYIVLAGDFNQWNIGEAVLDFPDIREAQVGATRGSRSIDRIFTNLTRSITESGTLAPLETNDGECASDHRVSFCRVGVARLKTFTWQTYTYRHYNDSSVKLFKDSPSRLAGGH